jgi:hypothetical protein
MNVWNSAAEQAEVWDRYEAGEYMRPSPERGPFPGPCSIPDCQDRGRATAGTDRLVRPPAVSGRA